MAVRIFLDRPHAHFTNLDFITGRVLLQLNANETISNIVVKLEGESKTKLVVPDPYPAHQNRERYEMEVHKLLYKTKVVFPSQDLQRAATPNASYTLPAGQHEYPFQFKIPFNNDCSNTNFKPTNFNMANLRLEVARESGRHVKKTLPPSMSGLPGQAEIRYYVKATVQRPAFYKENFRALADFKFLPIEPPRPPKNSRQSYARRQHQFAPAVNIPAKPGIFRKASTATVADDDAVPPSISFEGRLPDPPIVTCNEPLPLRVLINKLNESPATLYLQLIELVLISDTTTQAHQLRRSDIANFILVSLSNLHVPLLPLENSKGSKEMEIDPALWSHAPLPNTVVPAFDTCNLSCKHWLDIKIGLSWGSGSRMNPELMVQTIRMPVQVYTGITPPQALLNAMANHPTTSRFKPPLPQRQPSQSQQPPPQFAPAPSDIPEEAPPSYQDAMADDLAPIDGPRRDYAPTSQQPAPAGSGEKGGWGKRLFPDSGR